MEDGRILMNGPFSTLPDMRCHLLDHRTSANYPQINSGLGPVQGLPVVEDPGEVDRWDGSSG